MLRNHMANAPFISENSNTSEAGQKIVAAAQNKYINALYEHLRLRLNANEAAMRLADLMLLLSPLSVS
jgi:hypothetical protein